MIRLIKMSIGADATADWPSAVHVNVLLKRNHHLVSLIAVHTMLHNALYCLFFFLIVEDAFLSPLVMRPVILFDIYFY